MRVRLNGEWNGDNPQKSILYPKLFGDNRMNKSSVVRNYQQGKELGPIKYFIKMGQNVTSTRRLGQPLGVRLKISGWNRFKPITQSIHPFHRKTAK